MKVTYSRAKLPWIWHLGNNIPLSPYIPVSWWSTAWLGSVGAVSYGLKQGVGRTGFSLGATKVALVHRLFRLLLLTSWCPAPLSLRTQILPNAQNLSSLLPSAGGSSTFEILSLYYRCRVSFHHTAEQANRRDTNRQRLWRSNTFPTATGTVE